MTAEELDQLIEQKKTQTQTVEFDRTEEKFREEFLRIISEQIADGSIG